MYLGCDKCVQGIPVLPEADGKESHLKELFIRDVKRLAKILRVGGVTLGKEGLMVNARTSSYRYKAKWYLWNSCTKT